MVKTILLTGATDGIGFAVAKKFAAKGHTLLLHGRSLEKLEKAEKEIKAIAGSGVVERYTADLSRFNQVNKLAAAITAKYDHLDIVINNAGVFKVSDAATEDGLDVRFMVNTIAPYLLSQRLMPLLQPKSRLINVSSAAQAPVNISALVGDIPVGDQMSAYAQSKLALTMWSRMLALTVKDAGPIIISVNPGSMLGSKMVQEAFGVDGGDINIGADILFRLALDDEHSKATGKYFDNDAGKFSDPHNDALNPQLCIQVMQAIEEVIEKFSES